MKFAIKLGQQFYYDGKNASTYEHSGFGRKENATAWSTREAAQRVVDFWYDNHGDPKSQGWYCTRDGKSVGKFVRIYDDKSKTTTRHLNDGPLPEVVEIETGRIPFSEPKTRD